MAVGNHKTAAPARTPRFRHPVGAGWPGLAGLALACLGLVWLGIGQARPVRADDGPRTYYTLSETWTDRPGLPRYGRPRWPAGHLPGGLASDATAGRVYAIDRTDRTVRLYAADGAFEGVLMGAGQTALDLTDPRDIGVFFVDDGRGGRTRRLAISDAGRDRVLLLDEAGAVLAELAVPAPTGITVSASQIYAASSTDRALYVWRHDGTPVVQVPIPDSTMPLQLALDRDPNSTGLMFVADPGARHAFSLVGTPGLAFQPWRYGRAWPVAGLTALLTIAAVDPRGEFHQYVVAGEPGFGITQIDQDARRGGHIPFDGVVDLELYYDGDAAVWATVQPDGLVRFADFNDVLRYTARSLQTFAGLHRIAVDGLVGLAEDSPRVQVLRRDGSVLGRLQLSRWPNPRIPARDVAAAGDRVYVLTASLGGAVHEVVGGQATWQGTSAGQPRRLLTALSAAGASPQGVGDRVAVLDTLNQSVLFLDRDLNPTGQVDVAGPEFRGLFDLDLGADRLVLADQQRSVVEIWTPDGQALSTTPIPGGLVSVAAGPAQDAFALAASGWVYHVAAGGGIDGQWPVGSAVDRPMDLDFGPDGRLYVADRESDVRIYVPADPAQQTRLYPPVTGDSPCHVIVDKSAVPGEIELGQTVQVVLRVDGTCPVEQQPADVMLVIDRSGSMAGDKLAAAIDAAVEFVARTDPALTRIGIIAFDHAPQRRHALADPDRTHMIEQLAGLTDGGGTEIVGALNAALDDLDAAGRADAQRVVVLLSDGISGRTDLPAALARAAAAGVETYAIGLGGGADVALLREVAGAEDRYFFTPSSFELAQIYGHIARRVEATRLFATAVVTDAVPANMAYLPGSGAPAEPEISPDGRLLTWRLSDVLEPGFELAYRLRPLEPGTHPTNVEAGVAFEDGLAHRGRAAFPVPRVVVRDKRQVYLPLAFRQRCDAARQAVDVVLVIDASTSMLATTAGGRTRLAAAAAAAGTLLDRLAAQDRAAVVTFNREARVLAPLTADRNALRAALGAISTQQQTRIDLGIAAARGLLVGPDRRPASRPAIVLLTDGLANPVPVEVAVAEAEVAEEAGITLYTVGLGDEIDRAALERIATHAGGFRHAPDGEDLAAIYTEIARELPCPGLR